MLIIILLAVIMVSDHRRTEMMFEVTVMIGMSDCTPLVILSDPRESCDVHSYQGQGCLCGYVVVNCNLDDLAK